MAIDRIPLPDSVPGVLFATGFTDVGREPEAGMASVEADLLVCLLPDSDINLRFPSFKNWLNPAAAAGRALRFEIDDGNVPTVAQMIEHVEILATRLQQGDRLIVHCAAGWGRTSLVCAPIMLKLGIASLSTALVTIRAARPGAGPENPTQREHLARLAAHYGAAD